MQPSAHALVLSAIVVIYNTGARLGGPSGPVEGGTDRAAVDRAPWRVGHEVGLVVDTWILCTVSGHGSNDFLTPNPASTLDNLDNQE